MKKKLKLDNMEECKRCNGFGKIIKGSFPLENFVKCKECNGKGKVSKILKEQA